MAKKKVKKGAPGWMATYSDMATLMMTFFVIMLSFASMDIQKFKDMLGSVHEAFGVTTKVEGQYQAVLQKDITPAEQQPKPEQSPTNEDWIQENETMINVQGVDQEALEREAAAQEIRTFVTENGISDQTDVQVGKRGLRIRVKGTMMFDAGEAEIKPAAENFLNNIVTLLNKFNYYLHVEGHTDSIPISTERFPSNWELSGARASAVLRFLIAKNIDPKRLSSIGLSDNYPLASNATSEGRSTNRRVEFVLTKTSVRQDIN